MLFFKRNRYSVTGVLINDGNKGIGIVTTPIVQVYILQWTSFACLARSHFPPSTFPFSHFPDRCSG